MQNKRDSFLDLLEGLSPGQKGATANYFFRPIREQGMTDPAKICRWVYAKALRAFRNPHNDDSESDKWWIILRAMKLHRETALGMAEWALWWEGLPAGDKEAIREPNRQQYKNDYMSRQPATPKQIALIRKLGHREPISNRLEASQIIDRLLSSNVQPT